MRRAMTRSYRRLRLRLPQPWSRWLGRIAYAPRLAARHTDTRRAFAEERVIEPLAAGRAPLEGIGAGLSERVVEIPWAIRALSEQAASRVLDIGTVFSPVVYQRLLLRQRVDVDAADLAEADIPGLRSHVADVRDLPFPDSSFEVAICISTLEHVGMDNAKYGVDSGGGGDAAALRELGRVAKVVLVTVPAGDDENMGWQRQYAPSTFRRVVAQAGLAITRLDLFAHDPVLGWSTATEEAVVGRRYGQDAVAAAAVICAQLGRG